jgi:hypothetical protein
MTRNAKLKLAALATTLVATLGTVGTAGIIASPDAAIKGPTFAKNGNWCC